MNQLKYMYCVHAESSVQVHISDAIVNLVYIISFNIFIG